MKAGEKRGRRENVERSADIVRRFKSGETLRSISDSYGVTKQAINQIIKRRGLTSKDGGWLATVNRCKERQRAEVERIREFKILRTFGCSVVEFEELNGSLIFSAGLAKFYIQQKRSAWDRGIDWELSFKEWVGIWRDSGRLSERGKGGYVMGRHGDSGPYKVGNVSIITSSDNAKEARALDRARLTLS